ncbi:hypothetical protein HNR12_002516 [Streptomonospora nanhaiensis]|uniref:Uncharacterized protein n=1 Tax=Streptomonospora nanhaiensis TaxID=1323731 RepID=A0A853BL27_9ACTN|nr:hypothetical protein [Streptomonospora nanhaiensis]NYI96239.1 hypothetical protein [Streptomonospora nanhaiensis]
MALEEVREPDAARRAMARGEALADLVGAPLEFAGARPDSPGPIDADPGSDESADVFVAVALWTAATGAEGVLPALERLHEHWRARGMEAALRPLGGGARVSARDADGFAYTAQPQHHRAGIVLRVVTPRYTNPEPDRPFVGIFAQGEVPPPEAGGTA